VASVSIELRDLGEQFEMSRYVVRNNITVNLVKGHRVGQDKPRKVSPTVAEKAKAFRDRRNVERESACQPSTSNGAAAADSLMELHTEMRSADTDMNVDEATGAVWVQLRAPEVRPPTRELWKQKWIFRSCVSDQ
jgi:hypothetical protein